MQQISSKLRWIKRFTALVTKRKSRAFSVITGVSQHANPVSFGVLKPAEKVLNFTKKGPITKAAPKPDLSFTKDKAFLKFLTLVNLKSQDKESISLSRLVAYNIFSSIKAEPSLGKAGFAGIAQGFQAVLKFLDKVSKDISADEELIQKACGAYSKGISDIKDLVLLLISDEVDKIIFTKEITGWRHEGRVEEKMCLMTDVGHSSHKFINDGLNYRVDLINPMIFLSEKLTEEDVKKVVELAVIKRADVIFISKNTEPTVEKFLIRRNSETQISICHSDLSESSSGGEEAFEVLVSRLPWLDNLGEKWKFGLKTAERVIMDGQSSMFFDSNFKDTPGAVPSGCLKKLVDVQLRSPNEAWIHKYKNDISECYLNLKDSIDNGVMADISSTFYFAAKELESLSWENEQTLKGIAIVQKALESSLQAFAGEDFEVSEYSYNKILEEWETDGTFIPKVKAKKVIFDIVSICNHLLSSKAKAN